MHFGNPYLRVFDNRFTINDGNAAEAFTKPPYTA
jgi:hypothetical protein